MILREIFNSAYEYNIELDHRNVYLVQFRDRDGRYVEVEFLKNKFDIWTLEFTRDAAVKLTGEGDAPKILSTISRIVHEFLDKKLPAFLVFSAAKEDRARASVYRRMIMKGRLPEYQEIKYPDDRFKIPQDTEAFDEIWRLYRQAGGEDTAFMVIAHRDELVKEGLNEVFDRTPEYEVEVDSRSFFKTSQSIGDRRIVFTAERADYEDSWELQFKEVRNGRSTIELTGSGNELEVFSMVANSIIEFVQRYQPEKITFSAARDGARSSLYRRLMQRALKGYYPELDGRSGDQTSDFFTYVREH